MRFKIRTFLIILVFIIISFGGAYLYQKFVLFAPEKNQIDILPVQDNKEIINSAIFRCADNKNIQAIFFQDKVELTLSDGRNMLLTQAISASGARYANPDESFVFWNKGDSAFILEADHATFRDCLSASTQTEKPVTQIANPASTNCIKLGASLSIKKRGDGGEYGVCFFEDNRQCEEWSLLRGDCPIGGFKVTGYENDAQVFCVISGGTIEGLGTENPICKRIDGTRCTVLANFNGECPDPNNPNPSAGNIETP